MTPGEMILVARQKCIKFYKQYEKILVPISKFILTLAFILIINNKMGYMGTLNKFPLIIGVSIISMFLTLRYINIIFMIWIAVHMSAFNLLWGVVTIAFFIILYSMYIRLYPMEGILIIVTMFALKLQIGYIVPLLAGLFGGISCIVAISIGVMFNYMGQEIALVMESITRGSSVNVLELMISIINKNVITNTTMLATICIFSVVFLIVYIIRRLSIDYAPYIAIAIGGVMNLLGFGIAILFLNIKIDVFLLIVMTILSIILAMISQFMAKVLDYSRAELIQFEDEDNYYYVKVVPKVSMNINKKKVEQIYTTTTKENTVEL